MESPDTLPPIRVGAGPDGSLTYLVDLPPEALPPVTRRDLEHAWHAARRAALAEQWGTVRIFRFRRPEGGHSDLVLADRDASCWAGALDAIHSMATRRGLSLCLRLLALIDLLARSPWAMPLVRLARDGAEPDAALLQAAATEPLNHEARFDPTGFRARLARHTTSRLDRSLRMSRASLLLLLSALAQVGCSAGSLAPGGGSAGGSSGGSFSGGAPSRSDLATQTACRDRVNEMYDRRNRADIYMPNSSINTPFSANYQPGTTDRGLADRFAYDGTINECLRNSGAGAGRAGGDVATPPSSTRAR